MRDYLHKIETEGVLSIFDPTTNKFELVSRSIKCEYEHDHYTNANMKGIIKSTVINHTLNHFLNSKFKKIKFEGFYGDIVVGKIEKFNIDNAEYYKTTVNFSIKELTKVNLSVTEEVPVKIKLYFKAPYIQFLGRELGNSWGYDDSYLLKFTNDEYSINVKNNQLTFVEKIFLLPYNEPDSIFNRMLYPFMELTKEDDINNQLDEKFMQLKDIYILFAFLINSRVNCFGYECDIFNIDDKLIYKAEYKEAYRNCGKDFTLKFNEIDHEFEMFWTQDNLSLIINSFLNLDAEKKQKIIALIHGFLTVGEIIYFKAKVLSLVSILEGISKHINPTLSNPNPTSSEVINGAILKNDIDVNGIELEMSYHNLSYISEYRNYLAHFGEKKVFDKTKIFVEYKKAHIIARRLILSEICPTLPSFPFPRLYDNSIDFTIEED